MPGNIVPASDFVRLQYNALDGKRSILLLIAMSPLWALFVPYALCWMIFNASMQHLPVDAFFIGAMSLASSILLFVGFSFWRSLDRSFILSPAGMRVPLRFFFAAGGRRFVLWRDLVSVQTRDKSEHESEMVLQLNRGRIVLSMQSFTKQDLRKLVLATQYHSDQSHPAARSYTEIWQEELNARFSPTVFVPLPPGTKLQDGRVEVLGQVSCGGLSAIYMTGLPDGKRAILKEAVLPSHADQSVREKALEMFAREAQTLIKIDHQRVCKVLDHFTQDGRHYLLMEHIPGTDLRRFVRDNGPQHEEVALRWMLEVAQVLSYLHGMNPPIVHRDLTPDNLIFTASGGIAVIDFGAANAFVAEATGTLVGKQNYIPPEQFRGKTVPQSDIYALGCTLFFLLTGTDPEPMVQSHPRDLVPSISDSVDALVARCTALDAGERYSDCESLRSQIRSIITQLRNKAGAGI